MLSCSISLIPSDHADDSIPCNGENGSKEEVQESLQSEGIEASQLLLELGGSLDSEEHWLEWLQQQRCSPALEYTSTEFAEHNKQVMGWTTLKQLIGSNECDSRQEILVSGCEGDDVDDASCRMKLTSAGGAVKIIPPLSGIYMRTSHCVRTTEDDVGMDAFSPARYEAMPLTSDRPRPNQSAQLRNQSKGSSCTIDSIPAGEPVSRTMAKLDGQQPTATVPGQGAPKASQALAKHALVDESDSSWLGSEIHASECDEVFVEALRVHLPMFEDPLGATPEDALSLACEGALPGMRDRAQSDHSAQPGNKSFGSFCAFGSIATDELVAEVATNREGLLVPTVHDQCSLRARPSNGAGAKQNIRKVSRVRKAARSGRIRSSSSLNSAPTELRRQE